MTTASQDADHLRLLSILYYVWGGLTLALSCCGLGYFGIMGGVLGGVSVSKGEPAPAVVAGVMLLIGVVAIGFAVAVGALQIWTGRNLARKQRYTYCLVMAVITCLSFPFGTALGVFTIVVLMRPAVKQMFGVAPA